MAYQFQTQLQEKVSHLEAKTIKLRFCEKDTKFLQNHHLRFVLCSKHQIYGGDFAKFCGLLRIYELYLEE